MESPENSPASAEADAVQAAQAVQSIMEDFAFGGIEADDALLLESERARWSGLRHAYAMQPLDPRPGDAVTITVTVGPDLLIDHLAAYVTTDGSEPAGSRGRATNGATVWLTRSIPRWEQVIWSYVDHWQGVIPAQAEGTFVRYVIEGWREGDAASYWCREMHIDGIVEPVTCYGYSVDRDAPPTWAREAIVYHLFVDRFRNPALDDEAHRFLPPDALRSGRFFGGTLRGVLEQLDYIAGLGVTTLWLSPIFATPTNHGYDVIDYYAIEPRIGTADDLRALVQAAHARGLRVLLDLVVNHVSLHFAPFARALASLDDPHRSWFSFGERYSHGYRTFFDVRSMPQFNLEDPSARAYILEVARYWLAEFDVDGYRLDYAAGPSHAFWSAFRRACRAAKPDCWVFGEVTRTGDLLRTYTGRLDGCLDFGFTRAVRRLCTLPDGSIAAFAAWLERHRAFFGAGSDAGFLMPAFLDNHDMNRFLFVAGDDKATLRMAAGLLFALGGPPILYYGTEVGLSQPRAKGPHREESRHPMLWGNALQDRSLLEWFRRWIDARRRHPALLEGELRTLHLDDVQGTWLIERRSGADRVLFAINMSRTPQMLMLPPGNFVDLEGNSHRDTMELPGRAVCLLT